MRSSRLLIPLATLGLLLTSGCTAPGPEPAPSESAASEPFFASEEEAVEAAQGVLSRYVTAINQVLNDGGALDTQLDGVATRRLIEQQDVGFSEYRSRGLSLIGETTVDSFELQQYLPGAAAGETVLVAYFCRDVGATDVVNADGESLVPPDRQSRVAFQAEFTVEEEEGNLVIAGDEQWQNDNFCA